MYNSSQLAITPMVSSRFPLTTAILNEGIFSGVAPGMVAGYWSIRNPNRVEACAVGQRRLLPTPQPLNLETPFDLSSVSKIMATATLAAVLVDRRWIQWDTSLRSVFPDYEFDQIKIRHLLSHTAGFEAWEPYWENLIQRFLPKKLHEVSISARQSAMRELVFKSAPTARPGEKALYSDISFLLLGFLLEEVLDMPLDHAVRRYVWEPMGLRNAFYSRVKNRADQNRLESVAATEDSSWRGGVLQGQVHDDNCWAMGGYSGHAGAFGPIRDVLHFARRLFSGFLSRETLISCWTRVAEPKDCERTLGWDTPSRENPSVGRLFSKNTVGHLGYTGTSLWIDLDAGLAVALLTNRVHPTRENIKIREFRPRFHDAIRSDLSALSR